MTSMRWSPTTAARSPRSSTDPGVRAIGLGILLLSALAVIPAPAETSKEQTDSPQQSLLLRRLRESRAPYHTFATRFVQRKHLDILQVDLESEGMIFFRRPGSVRYEILSPSRSLMVYDGKKVRCYAFSEGKWNLLNSPSATAIGQVLRQIGRWIQGDFDADRKMFEISVVSAQDGGGCIHLVPHSEALAKYVRRVEIYVVKATDDYQVNRVIIRESDVDMTDMRFRQERRNQEIPEGTFATPEASEACQAMLSPKDNTDPNQAGPTRSGAAEKPKS
jgi:outer membrane lipoprotein-sorting protein